MTKRTRSILVTALLLLIFAYLQWTENSSPASPPGAPPQASTPLAPSSLENPAANQYLVTRVVDGDTILLDNGEKVRYVGIDTPETVHPKKAVQCFGKEAKEKNRELVEGKIVRLQKDVSDRDRYGRWLRFVTVGDVFVNDALVRQGYARAATFPPDVSRAKQFREAQQEARAFQRGLWRLCQGL